MPAPSGGYVHARGSKFDHKIKITAYQLVGWLGRVFCKFNTMYNAEGKEIHITKIEYAVWGKVRLQDERRKEKLRKVSNHRVPQILKINKNMLACQLSVKIKHRQSKTQKELDQRLMNINSKILNSSYQPFFAFMGKEVLCAENY
jgi:hypothetical protein